jgi:hypothetical protein
VTIKTSFMMMIIPCEPHEVGNDELEDNVVKLFCLSLTLRRQNKLECLTHGRITCLTRGVGSEPEILQGANALAYLAVAPMRKKKSFVKVKPFFLRH